MPHDATKRLPATSSAVVFGWGGVGKPPNHRPRRGWLRILVGQLHSFFAAKLPPPPPQWQGAPRQCCWTARNLERPRQRPCISVDGEEAFPGRIYSNCLFRCGFFNYRFFSLLHNRTVRLLEQSSGVLGRWVFCLI